MNKTYYVLGALVAVLLIGYVVTSSKNDEQVSGTPVNSEMTPLAGTGDYVIDSEKSVLNWQGRKPLLNNYYDKGTVKVSAGSATLTDGLITAGEFTIDMNTITALSTGKNAGMDFLTKHLKSPDFFDVEKYPTAQLKLTSVEKAEGENTFKVKGDLTVKDKTNLLSSQKVKR
jgi:polyisoprenoid-binding protein YceI